MKIILSLFCLILAGCQTVAPAPLPTPAKPAPEPRPALLAPADPNPALAQRVRQQAQYIDALISRNEALSAKLAGGGGSTAATPVLPASEPAASPAPTTATPLSDPTPDAVTPNAEGVIDLTAIAADAKSAENVNPFVVRGAATGPAREVTLRVSGILAGKIPCAIVNDRLVQVNDVVETLTVERIGADWVSLRFSGQRLRVPVSDQSVKVKLPL